MKNLRFLFPLLILSVFTGCGNQPELPNIPGVKGPYFNITNGQIVVSTVFTQFSIPAGFKVPVDKLENSHVEFTVNQEGGTLLQAYIDIEEIENEDFSFADPETLPGGRPLPGVIGGELPALAFTLEQAKDSTFYVSKKVFGFFVPVDLGIEESILTWPLKIDGKHIGNVSAVGNDENGENAGFLLLLNLSAAQNKQLQKLLKLSKRSPQKVY